MRQGRVWRFTVCLVLMLAPVTACVRAQGGTQGHKEESRDAAPGSKPVTYPETRDTTEASAPVLVFKEYRAPGFGELKGYGERFATLRYSNMVEGAPSTISILDFSTGKTHSVVSRAVNFDKGFDILDARGSDRWIVWEEFMGDDQLARFEVQWKLYVAKINPDSFTCGKPILVDEAETSMHSRAMFRFEGDALYWMTNSTPNRRQEGTVSGAIVKVRDLNSGTTRTVCETNRHYISMSISDGKVIVTEVSSDSERGTVRVIDPATNREVWSLDLRNAHEIFHFPLVHDGAVAWTVAASGGLSHPDLFFRGTDGITHRVRNLANDPTQVGDYLFYDGVREVPNGLGQRKTLFSIGGYDIETNKVFTLIEADASDGRWDMPMGIGYSADTFVISKDTAPFAPNPEAAKTAPLLIRRYTVPAR